MYFDTTYLCLMAPAFLLMIFAQWWVSSTYKKWSRIENSAHISGAGTANRLIQYGGLNDVRVEPTGGKLTDHYDPRSRTRWTISPLDCDLHSFPSLISGLPLVGS